MDNSLNQHQGDGKEAQEAISALETRLNATPTLETDAVEFLAIAGLEYRYWQPLQDARARYHHGRQYADQLEETRKDRRQSLSPSEQMTESLLCKAIRYEHGSGLITSIGNFWESSQRPHFRIPGLGQNGKTYLAQQLDQYGLLENAN